MDLRWHAIFESETIKIQKTQFWNAVWIWNLKPNVVNRRIFDAQILNVFSADQLPESNLIDLAHNVLCSASVSWDTKSISDYIKQKFALQPCSLEDATIFSDKSFIFLKRLFLRGKTHSEVLEICITNNKQDESIHFPIRQNSGNERTHPSIFPLRIRLAEDKIKIEAITNFGGFFSDHWVKYLLLPKLCKWATKSNLVNFQQYGNNSLKLIPVDEYSELYSNWREKYGQQLIKNWTENTDPLKFVYEDIAIAVYLSLLWRRKKVNFIDMGCGNGLLVHILTQEGHKGLGIDVRSRKIWSLYPSTTNLQTGTVTPEKNNYHPDAEWIIGNHSDELTPWIPIFAARNSYDCNFFLLPCCAYELNGQRYQRKNSSLSVYNDYIQHIKNMVAKLGFEIKVDRLRIPSTKRICLISDGRSYTRSSYKNVLNDQLNSLNILNMQDFKPRKSVEDVRNCTKIDKSVTSRICDTISTALIRNQINIQNVNSGNDVWTADYSIGFPEAISILIPEDLKILKNECGGLQTLLRNNHSIYLIRGGRIYFRKPSEKIVTSNWKKRPCWFFHHHPWRCPLPENKCAYFH